MNSFHNFNKRQAWVNLKTYSLNSNNIFWGLKACYWVTNFFAILNFKVSNAFTLIEWFKDSVANNLSVLVYHFVAVVANKWYTIYVYFFYQEMIVPCNQKVVGDNDFYVVH